MVVRALSMNFFFASKSHGLERSVFQHKIIRNVSVQLQLIIPQALCNINY